MESFPKCERKPFDLIVRKSDENTMEILRISEGNKFIGLAINILYKDLVLLDYFAVKKEYRDRGYGTRALSLLKNHYADRRLFLEIEIPDESSSNSYQRKIRKQFYLRNGMSETGIRVSIFDFPMELLIAGDKSLSFDEYHSIFYNIIGQAFSDNVKLISA